MAASTASLLLRIETGNYFPAVVFDVEDDAVVSLAVCVGHGVGEHSDGGIRLALDSLVGGFIWTCCFRRIGGKVSWSGSSRLSRFSDSTCARQRSQGSVIGSLLDLLLT